MRSRAIVDAGRASLLTLASLSLMASLGSGCGSDSSGPDMNPVLGTSGAGAVAGSAPIAGSSVAPGTAGATSTGAAGSAAGAAGRSAAGAMAVASAGTGAAGMSAAAGSGSAAGAMSAETAGMPAAGSGGTAGSAGASGMSAAAGAAGSAPGTHEDLGEGDGKDVITIGDSWMSLFTTGIQQSLEKVSGRDYRNYGVPGTLVLNEQIPNQYVSAKKEDPDIKTVVMTGGGNDILTTSCADESCNSIVDQVSDRLNKLMMDMGKDGVEDIILIGYTYPDDQSKHESLDYSRMISKMICTTATMPRCHFLDSTTLDLTLMDGIHPNPAGYDLIGKTVWELMQSEGVRR